MGVLIERKKTDNLQNVKGNFKKLLEAPKWESHAKAKHIIAEKESWGRKEEKLCLI